MSTEIATTEDSALPPAELMLWQRDQFAALKSGLAKNETMKIEGKPYIKRNGWRMIAAGFNVTLELVKDNSGNVLHTRMEGEDELGKYYVHTYTARATLPNGRYAECDGACSSRDAFFSKAHGERKPPSDIDEADIIATAQTVAYNRAISDLVGGAEVSAEEMLGKKNVAFKPQAPPTPVREATVETVERVFDGEVVEEPPSEMSSVEIKQAEIKEMVAELTSIKGMSSESLMLEFTQFPDKNDPDKMVGGKESPFDLSDRATPVVHNKVKKEYDRLKGGE